MQAIKTTGLTKRYGDLTAVDTLDLEIRRGELFALLGVNGAGKTTAIKMLSCRTKPTAGDALVGGCSITEAPEQVKRLIGVSPQETAVAPNLSVKENLEMICGIHGFSGEKTRKKVRALSKQFALDSILGFPLVLLLLLSAIQANIPVSLFEIEILVPGINVFGLSFMTLFSGSLIAKDRESALLQRLYTTPLTGMDFILGYMLPLLPIAVGQTLICYLFAVPLGLTVSVNILYALVGILPVAVFHIALGLLCGSLLGVKQVGGICGALLTNLSAWLSGVWFDLELVGGIFEKVANVLPFLHAAEMEKALCSGQFDAALSHLLPVALYAVLVTVTAVACFLGQMKKQ